MTAPTMTAPRHERVSDTRVEITFPAPVTRDEAEAYCAAQAWFGYHAVGYSGYVILDYRNTEQTPGAEWVATAATYRHSRSCE